jgi:hypothetical protein
MPDSSAARERATRPDEAPSVVLGRLINGFQVSQAIHVAATLGLADLLAEGPATSDELASSTATHPPTLYRLLRALAGIGIFRQDSGGRFALTPLGECLRSDAPGSLAGWAAYVGRTYYWEAWGHLLHSVKTGETAFRSLHGTDVWAYRSRHPDESAIFDRAMESLTRRVDRSLLAAYDFGRFEVVADIGGGNGALLSAILTTYPAMRGILFDQAHVVAEAAAVLEAAGVDDRCEVVEGDFLDEVPEADAYLLKSILHDWADAESTAILTSCRRALRSDGAVLVVERLIGAPNESPEAAFSDLNMLLVPGGRERTLDEFGALFADAGLELVGATPSESGFHVIEGAAAPSREDGRWST